MSTPTFTQRWSDYRKTALRSDTLSSVVVFLVALPFCMGMAIASGAPPSAGLISAAVGGIAGGLLSGSPLQVSGPSVALSVIALEVIHKYGFELFTTIVLLSGLLQLLAGTLRLGRYFRAVPPTIVHGMLASIGVLIFASQLYVLVDSKPKTTGVENLFGLPEALWDSLAPPFAHRGGGPVLPHYWAALLGILTIVSAALWTRRASARWRLLPAPLIAVGLATVVATVFNLPVTHVAVPDSLGEALRLPGLARWGQVGTVSVFGTAIAMAAIASAETLLSATAVDQLHHGPRTRYDQELVAQGVGNVLCGLLGGLPMSGGILRSTANIKAGAKTRMSVVFHGLWILLLASLVPGLLRRIPVASLAAVLVVTGFRLINFNVAKRLIRARGAEAVVYVATVLAIISTDLLKGVLFGLGLALIKLILTITSFEVSLRQRPPAPAPPTPEQRPEALALDPTLPATVTPSGQVLPPLPPMILSLAGAATFLRLPKLAEALDRIQPRQELTIDSVHLDFIDHACADLLRDREALHAAAGGRLVVDWADIEDKGRGAHFPTAQMAAVAPPVEGQPTSSRPKAA
jgi:MFS superfamily sulfate permease-like transporter